jgi:hypothetical protein
MKKESNDTVKLSFKRPANPHGYWIYSVSIKSVRNLLFFNGQYNVVYSAKTTYMIRRYMETITGNRINSA